MTDFSSPFRYLRPVALLWQWLALAAAMALSPPARADVPPAQPAITPAIAPHITATLLAERPARPGETILLAIAMAPAAGWHGYWQNPGDAGFAMRLEWALPAGARVAAPLYTVPETLLVGGLMNHVYQRDYAVLVPFTLPAGAAGSLPVALKAQWLACSAQICVPEEATLHTSVTVGTGAADPRFDGWRAHLPAPLDAPAQLAASGSHLRLAIPFPAGAAIEAPHFFPAADGVVDYAAPQGFARKGDVLILTLARAHNAALPASLPGVLRFNRAGDGLAITTRPGPVPTGGTPLADGTGSTGGFGWLLLAAVVGGLLLNVMPCVFPILSLKALSLARAGESAAQARAEGLAYAAGVVLACVALGAAMLALRAAGEEVGWAFQLQEPGVVAALLLLAAAITANLAGLFELAVPGFIASGAGATRAGGINGAFATGLLGAFVATPCTGPFMAGAMGAALVLPVGPALALFAGLGLGIALPFLAIAFVPLLRRALPRPGGWMGWLRRLLALPMGLTALALLWLAGRLGGSVFMAGLGLSAAGLLLVLALIGRWQRRGRAAAGRGLALLAALGAAAGLLLPGTIAKPAATEADLLAEQPFTDAALAAARAQGRPVFAYFTADWCLTCKVNERLAIETAATRDAFAKAGVVVLKGDWTRRDPAITRYLASQGAAGVPLYVWYPARGGPALVLPQVLASDTLGQLAASSSRPQ
ncbi:MAG TPA: thioredoxin family protein [Novosphingobium sp.]|nr:thioredoxin family protein [Novosphingobium sp.]